MAEDYMWLSITILKSENKDFSIKSFKHSFKSSYKEYIKKLNKTINEAYTMNLDSISLENL